MTTTKLPLGARYKFECFDPKGNKKWTRETDNVACNDGLDYILNVGLKSGTAISTWYLGLKGGGTASAADTLSAHASWSELNHYVDTNRPSVTWGAVATQSVDNSASVAVYTASATGAVVGAFLASTQPRGDSTGASVGTLLSAGDFSSTAAMTPNDLLNVTITFSAGQKA